MGVVGPHFCFNPTENGAQQEGAALFQRSRIQQDSPPCSLLDIWSQDGRGEKKIHLKIHKKIVPAFKGMWHRKLYNFIKTKIEVNSALEASKVTVTIVTSQFICPIFTLIGSIFK